ncbi:MAG: dihydrofolate reductase, partial [Firmicutes bacterium]|nr:dihydrofolate reductase [Bacillota bacterium]
MFKKLVAIEPVNLVPSGFERLKELAEETVFYDTIPTTDEEKIARIGDADGALISWTSTMPRAVIEAAPNLKYVGMCCSLYSEESANVDIRAARERGIVVKGVKDYGDQGVAEYVTFELINYLHGFTGKSWIEKQKELTGMKIGMIGLGVMGSNLARNMQSKGYNVAVYDLDPARVEKHAEMGFTGCASLADLK